MGVIVSKIHWILKYESKIQFHKFMEAVSNAKSSSTIPLYKQCSKAIGNHCIGNFLRKTTSEYGLITNSRKALESAISNSSFLDRFGRY